MWTVQLAGGPRRVNHAAVAIDDKVYSFGGHCIGEDYIHRRPIDIHVLDTVFLRWRPLPTESNPHDVPFQRYGHTVVAYGDCVYLWGGRDDNGPCNTLYCFDICALVWTRPKVCGQIPCPRDGHSACIIGQRMYVFGGLEANRYSQDVHFLDFEGMHWQHLHTMGEPPLWRCLHAASALGDRMYVWGGRIYPPEPFHPHDEVYCNRLAYLDTVTASWVHPQINDPVPVGRRSHSCFVYNGELYAFGGFNGTLMAHFGDMHKYSPDTSRWSLVSTRGPGPCARRSQCCVVVGDRLFVFGGTSPKTNHGNHLHMGDFISNGFRLRNHDDMYVLDFAPTLKSLAMLAVIDKGLDITDLPQDIVRDIRAMTTDNSLSRNVLY